MTRRITSSDIARAAGVSRTTVSFVLNDTEGTSISPETKARVLKAAEAVELSPRKDAYFQLTRSKSIDALIVLNANAEDDNLLRLIESNFPVILFGSIGHPKENVVSPNTWKAAERATQHLLSLGHRRIARITYAPARYVGARERLKAYRRALDRAKVGFDEKLVAYGDFSMESGYRAMREILGRRHRPTALFAGNDTIAVGAMAAVREAGLAVPSDIAVVGFDDLPFAAYAHPALTTVATQAREQGEQVALAALELLEGHRVGNRGCKLSPELIVRESCGAKTLPRWGPVKGETQCFLKRS